MFATFYVLEISHSGKGMTKGHEYQAVGITEDPLRALPITV